MCLTTIPGVFAAIHFQDMYTIHVVRIYTYCVVDGQQLPSSLACIHCMGLPLTGTVLAMHLSSFNLC
jgi:hypothetical protein